MQHRGIHIVHHRDGSWVVKRSGVKKPIAVYWTVAAAIHRGQIIARHEENEIVIHNQSGQIVFHDTYSPKVHVQTA